MAKKRCKKESAAMQNVVSMFGSNYNIGVGVVVGDKLVTSGHLFENSDRCFVKYQDQTLTVRREDALVCRYGAATMKSLDDYDVAVFQLDRKYNDFILSTRPIEDGEVLRCGTVLHWVGKNQSLLDSDEHLDRLTCKAEVVEHEGHFFHCKTGRILKEGCSGSPVFRGKEVVGILFAGVPGTKDCFFQSVPSLSELEEMKDIISEIC